MEPNYNYKAFAVLYVDDEEMSLSSFTLAYEDEFRILTASNAKEGLRLLEQHKDEIGLLMTDQRMPAEKGIWLLEKARQIAPKVIRILVTATTEYDVAIAAINTGAIYRYVSKPWDPELLGVTLKRGLEFFLVQRERDQLLREKLSVLRNMMMADRIVSLGLLAAGLSHHIRNPLTAVKTFLDLAPLKMEEEKARGEGLRDPEFWKEYYQNAQEQLDKITNLLKNLWTAPGSADDTFGDQVSVADVIAEVTGELGPRFAAKSIALEPGDFTSLPLLQADRAKIRKLFDLLLTDELVNLPSGTRVRLSGRLVEDGGAPAALIRVEDDGPGMPGESLRLLFDPFNPRGDVPTEYGINLMACYFIVHHHGGRVEAETAAGSGTVFNIRLPVNPLTAAGEGSSQGLQERSLFSQALWDKLLSPGV